MSNIHSADAWANYLQDPAVLHAVGVLREHGVSRDMALLLLEFTGLRSEMCGIGERLEEVLLRMDVLLKGLGMEEDASGPPDLSSFKDDGGDEEPWLKAHRHRYGDPK